jgi:superfamily I DNA/RNA helicase
MSEETITKEVKRTEEQLAFIEHPVKGVNASSIILSACAGSGKTASAVARLKFMLENGVDPSKIIYFSFTVAAVEELKNRIQNDAIKITTIHSFCAHLLGRMKKMKKISTFYDFIDWFKEYHKPKYGSNQSDVNKFYLDVEKLYDTAEYLSSEIAAFKLQTADNIKCKLPDYLKSYQDYQKQTKSMDFSDMLIVVRESLKEDKWLRMFRNQYDYVFIDEFQDTSSCQMAILLALNAKYYYLMGDKAQAIYGYSGANCDVIEAMLKRRRQTIEMNLSINFRSAKSIVENSNKHSHLQAIPFHQEEGKVHRKIILFEQLVEILKVNPYVAVLVRTNSVIREIERRLLALKIPIKYENYLKPAELEDIKKARERVSTKNKMRDILPHFGSADAVIEFIESNRNQQSHIKTIHRSKGLEFPICVVVNSISPEMIIENNLNIPKEYLSLISYDPDDIDDYESKNVHYVSVSRAKNELFFMIMDN